VSAWLWVILGVALAWMAEVVARSPDVAYLFGASATLGACFALGWLLADWRARR
jgi:hypothetical protein